MVAPTKSLVGFWDEARLRADQARSTSIRPLPGAVLWRTALEDVLRVGYGVQSQSRFVDGAWERVRWRTVPSAGALYPFEVIVSVVGEGSYLWDLEKGRLVPCGLPPLARDDLDAAGLAVAPGQRLQALIVLVARPWLSMKKYRLRGYPYCHLDVGHAATNLVLYASALGQAPILHLRFSHAFLAERLRLAGLCREPLAVLSFAGADPAPGAAPPEEPGAAGLEPPAEPEVLNWESLRGLLSLDSEIAPPCLPTRPAILQDPVEVPEDDVLPLPAGRSQPATPRDWRTAILSRRSAKGFREEPLTVPQMGDLLGSLRGDGLLADCPEDSAVRLGVRLIARNLDGLAGVFAYAPRDHALYRIDSRAEDPCRACMRQEIARNAAALIVLHAPICPLVDLHGYSAFAELHFRAAELAQRLYLAAARIGGVELTCIGGFDSEECAALARLTGSDEALYVILLGVPEEAAVKQDRLDVAFSHGYTTLKG
jgi:SagB-type dehydrogenase family enzyme